VTFLSRNRSHSTEESYTSKASFLDEDDISTYQSGNNKPHIFSGKLISRGMYRSNSHILINADVNGAANILRKVIPKAFTNGIVAVCSTPQVVNVR
jgi:putative transposase